MVVVVDRTTFVNVQPCLLERLVTFLFVIKHASTGIAPVHKHVHVKQDGVEVFVIEVNMC